MIVYIDMLCMIVDGVQMQYFGNLMFLIFCCDVDDILIVMDVELVDCMCFFVMCMKFVVELIGCLLFVVV